MIGNYSISDINFYYIVITAVVDLSKEHMGVSPTDEHRVMSGAPSRMGVGRSRILTSTIQSTDISNCRYL